ncbi:GNAT family N-acetyltransferase [Nocardioides rubriscoriae]|uniref:GNAT family N-acetyltransferase n=1 Tax=Nocardioides rubriscoriae TaxID=642762 RepID=UPI0011DFA053|nr:GNAT family protein [Nocardioides rubriscoriae]
MDITGLLPLRTERLVLREVRDADADAVLGYCGDAEVTRYLPFDVLDREGVLARMQRWRDDLARDPDDEPDRDWALTLVAEHDGAVVGDVMLRLAAGEVRTVAELGYVFDPAYAGRGLATEAARTLLDLAFGTLGCHRVFAQLDPRNHPSARLCERLGMTHEAHTRQDWWGKGEWSDTSVYGILRDEWPPVGTD